MAKKRNYKKESARRNELNGPVARTEKRKKQRQARAKMGLKPGDKREVDHKKPISKGGSNSTKNLRVVKRSTNRKKGVR